MGFAAMTEWLLEIITSGQEAGEPIAKLREQSHGRTELLIEL